MSFSKRDNNEEKIQSIQVLRGIAALLIVAFHFKEEIDKTFPGLGQRLFTNASMGVDLFFIISGIIIYHIADQLNSGVISSSEFLIKRFCRILPPYYVLILLLSGKTINSWYVAIRSMMFIPLPGSIGPHYGYPRLNVGWSLNYEILFYMIVALAIIFKHRKWLVVSTIITLLTIAPSIHFGWNHFDTVSGYNFNNTYLRMATNPILIEFLCGVFISYLYKTKIFSKFKTIAIATLSLSIIYLSYLFFSKEAIQHGPLTFMIPFAFLVLSLMEIERANKIKFPAVMLYFGEISFSIYLIHVRSLAAIQSLIDKVGNLKHNNNSGIFIFFIAFAMTLLMAHYYHKYIEIGLSYKIRALALRNKKRENVFQN